MRYCSVSLNRFPEIGDKVVIGQRTFRVCETEILGSVAPDPENARRFRFFPLRSARVGTKIVRLGRARAEAMIGKKTVELSIMLDCSLSAAAF